MPVTQQETVAAYDGTYLYSSGDQRNAGTLVLTGNSFIGSDWNGKGYCPYDGTYFYSVEAATGILKVKQSDLSTTATWAFPSGYNDSFWTTHDGTYLYALVYNTATGTENLLVQIDTATMTTKNSLSLTAGTALLANSLKYAVSWAFP